MMAHPVRTVPSRTANSTAKQPQPAPASQPKPSSGRELDIGKYDGGFEIDNEKRGEAVDGEAAQGHALNSSVSS
jgi:aurora kinase